MLLIGLSGSRQQLLNASPDSLKFELSRAKTDSARISILAAIANKFASQKPDSAFVYYDKALELARKSNNLRTLYELYNSKGTVYSDLQNFSMALFEFKKQLEVALILTDSSLISASYSNAGSVLNYMGLTDRAINAYKSALQYHNLLRDSLKTAVLYGRIGNLHLTAGKYEDAEAYYAKAYEIFEKKQLKRYMTIVLQNLGVIEKNRRNFEKGIELFQRAMALHEEQNNTLGVAQCIGNIGGIYYEQANYKKAIETIGVAIEIFRKHDATYDLAIALMKVGKSYNHLNRFEMARKTLEEALLFADSTMQSLQIEILEPLAKSYFSLGMKEKAYETLLRTYTIYASLHTKENSEIQESLRLELEIERRDMDMEILRKDNDLKENTIKWQNAQLVLYLLAIAFFFVLLVLLSRINRVRKRANADLLIKNAQITQQKEEIEAQRDEIEAQKEEIMSQRDQLEVQRSIAISQRDELSRVNVSLTDSILYAKNIQTALLPTSKELSESLGENFVLYKPLNIVSGDFYWVSSPRTQGANETVLAIADCTGHGVPGALMSVMGINFLNSIVNESGVTDPAAILNAVDDSIIRALSHTDEMDKSKDGMDMAVVTFDWQTMEMAFSSAKIRVLVWRKGEVFQLGVTKASLGRQSRKGSPFETATFTLQANDVLYLLTDGYIDQFGGPNLKKFLTNGLIEILKRIGSKPLDEQRKLLLETFMKWKGTHIQIDDVLVFGVRI